MASFIKNIIRKRKVRPLKQVNRVSYVHRSIHLGDISKVVLLASASSASELESVRKAGSSMASRGLTCRTVVILKEKFGFEPFCDKGGCKESLIPKERLSWAGIPERDVAESLADESFDLLVALNYGDGFTVDYLAFSARASFSAAMEDSSYFHYSLIVRDNGGGPLGIQAFIENLFKALSMFSSTADDDGRRGPVQQKRKV